jgi:hypothetical protein
LGFDAVTKDYGRRFKTGDCWLLHASSMSTSLNVYLPATIVNLRGNFCMLRTRAKIT